ncbi:MULTISPECIES: hypothetical protein [unclassified Janthinobacterium]|uniref:hypothetical protein n=1 Tax=unclassified Janthinobacterium TaxID=2610881 RepID=UPI00034A7FF6|nr:MULTISPECIES: hypothetical protein [unclassified Janthinobacterium]MEC5162754.1 hypothetical protein [Janthinobacterium sp. CG_S6]
MKTFTALHVSDLHPGRAARPLPPSRNALVVCAPAPGRASPFAAADGAALLAESDDAAGLRDYLVELAYFLFELKKTSVTLAQLAQFEADYFGVNGLPLPPLPRCATLCQLGLLEDEGGAVAFRFDCFRAYFLAQKFDTSVGLLRYAFTQKGFVELQSELDIYTQLHHHEIEKLTAAAPPPEPFPARGLAHLDLPDFGQYKDRRHGGEPQRRHSADEQECLIMAVAKSARVQRRARLVEPVLGEL